MEAAIPIIPAATIRARRPRTRRAAMFDVLKTLKPGQGVVWTDPPAKQNSVHSLVRRWNMKLPFDLSTFVGSDGKRYVKRREESPS